MNSGVIHALWLRSVKELPSVEVADKMRINFCGMQGDIYMTLIGLRKHQHL